MRVHLDPLGGLAGDMFAAALLDCRPELADPLRGALAAAGLARLARVEVMTHDDGLLAGTRVVVKEAGAAAHAHRAHSDIQRFLRDAELAQAVRDRSLDIFARLAAAEAAVHGVSPADVEFHEVGAWDSVADVVSAAWLIEALAADRWSCAPLPLGSGRISTRHGPLPVPAPATVRLLEGMPVLDDGVEGERVTPTGAAILRHLEPEFEASGVVGRLLGSGVGFGSARLPGLSNILRMLLIELPQASASLPGDSVAVMEFELDDQTPEDLAIAVSHLRALDGVRDLVETNVYGKKGRRGSSLRLLVDPHRLDAVADACLRSTSTLGVRWHLARRYVLPRRVEEVERDGRRLTVKRASRPDGTETSKIESDDLVSEPNHAVRQEVRRSAGEPR